VYSTLQSLSLWARAAHQQAARIAPAAEPVDGVEQYIHSLLPHQPADEADYERPSIAPAVPGTERREVHPELWQDRCRPSIAPATDKLDGFAVTADEEAHGAKDELPRQASWQREAAIHIFPAEHDQRHVGYPGNERELRRREREDLLLDMDQVWTEAEYCTKERRGRIDIPAASAFEPDASRIESERGKRPLQRQAPVPFTDLPSTRHEQRQVDPLQRRYCVQLALVHADDIAMADDEHARSAHFHHSPPLNRAAPSRR
jgi:hypothetical protein